MTEGMRAAVGVIVTREARLEDALRHARGIVAAEVADLRADLEGARATGMILQVTVNGRIRANERYARLAAQIDERERWIAAWDAALAPEAVIVESGRVISSAKELAAFVAQGVPRRDPDLRD